MKIQQHNFYFMIFTKKKNQIEGLELKNLQKYSDMNTIELAKSYSKKNTIKKLIQFANFSSHFACYGAD